MPDADFDTVKAALVAAIREAPLTGYDEDADGRSREDPEGYGGSYHRICEDNAAFATDDGRVLVLGGDVDEFYRPALDLDVLTERLIHHLNKAD